MLHDIPRKKKIQKLLNIQTKWFFDRFYSKPLQSKVSPQRVYGIKLKPRPVASSKAPWDMKEWKTQLGWNKKEGTLMKASGRTNGSCLKDSWTMHTTCTSWHLVFTVTPTFKWWNHVKSKLQVVHVDIKGTSHNQPWDSTIPPPRGSRGLEGHHLHYSPHHPAWELRTPPVWHGKIWFICHDRILAGG